MNIADRLKPAVEFRGDSSAIIDTKYGVERRITFGALEHASSRLALDLSKAELKQGDCVLLLHEMSAELYVLLLALFKLGAVPLFMDPSFGTEYIERCFQMSAPVALITSTRGALLQLTCAPLGRIKHKFSTGLALFGTHSLPDARSFIEPTSTVKVSNNLEPTNHDEYETGFENAKMSADAPALITFTSGSTGQPKAIVRTHGFLDRQLEVLIDALALKPGEVDLTTLPVFLLANLAAGVTSVIPDANLRKPGTINARPVLRQVVSHAVVRTTAAPAFLSRLHAQAMRDGIQLPSLRRIFTGGGPVFPKLLDQLQQLAPNAETTILYGSSESEPISHIAASKLSAEDLAKMRTGGGLLVGRPEPFVNVHVVNENFNNVTTLESSKTYEIGEIVVTGDHVIKGYLNGVGDQECKFIWNESIWHRTGDSGYFDEHGRLWLTGRCSAALSDDRGVLFPFQVESIAVESPRIARAACVAHGGKRILLLEEDKDVAKSFLFDYSRLLSDRLDWAQLDEIKLVRKIPVDSRHNSKVVYARVHEMLH